VYYRIWCSALVVLAVVVWSCVVSFVHCVNSNLHTVHTAHDPTPHNHSQHNQCRIPYAVVHGLVLLMMSIVMIETCGDRILIVNIGLVASCWFLSLHPIISGIALVFILQQTKSCSAMSVSFYRVCTLFHSAVGS